MKKTLLLFSVITASIANSQSITVNDTLSIGDKLNYYMADSSVSSLDAVTGAGVTWDYNDLAFLSDFNVETNVDSIILASTSVFSASYPQSKYSEFFVNGVNTFFRNTADSVITDGFVFNDGTNDYVVRYHNNPLISAKFPMTFGTTYVDYLDGEAIAGGQTVAITGNATVNADGTGTFLLAGNTYTNVIRVKTVEILSGTSVVGPVNVNRTSYVYYETSVSNLPIFSHVNVIVELGSLGTVNVKSVWSKDPLLGYAGNEELIENVNVNIYPNPASSNVTIATNNAKNISIINTIGETVKSINNPSNIENISLINLANGVYFIQVKNEKETITKKLVIK